MVGHVATDDILSLRLAELDGLRHRRDETESPRRLAELTQWIDELQAEIGALRLGQPIPIGEARLLPGALLTDPSRCAVGRASQQVPAAAADGVRALLPLLRFLDSDEATSEQRIALREQASTGRLMDEGITELASLARRLTSNASRSHARSRDARGRATRDL